MYVLSIRWSWCYLGELTEAKQNAQVTGELTKTAELTTYQRPDSEWKTGIEPPSQKIAR